MSEIKAIETSYKGYRFRSRLEARWAVFFDALGIDWRYEPEGFHVGGELGTPYLPDFYLPSTHTWVEVKGEARAFNLSLLADAVEWGMGLPETDESVGTTRGLLLLGPIPRASNGFWPCHPILQHHKGGWVGATRFSSAGVLPTEDDTAHYFDSMSGGFHGYPEAWRAVTRFWEEELGVRQPCPPRVGLAYAAARSARFEHGETPR